LSKVLLVFSRYPRLGKVKTRLAPLLSPVGCLELHRSLLLDTLERVSSLGVATHLFLAECSSSELSAFASDAGVPSEIGIHHQSGDDLGERMWNAYREVRRDGDRVVFLGTDSPSLPIRYLREGWERLEDQPVVIGPVEDGGYYLLGLSQARQEVFEGIDWGTPFVLDQTIAKLNPGAYHLLPSWYDVDTPSDLRRLEQDLNQRFEGFPTHTDQFLQSRR